MLINKLYSIMKFFVLLSVTVSATEYPIYGPDSLMDQKEFGTCTERVYLRNLKWEVDPLVTAQINCFNRIYAEKKYSFLDSPFMEETGEDGPITFYDPVNLVPVFKAPIGRTWEDFIEDSTEHGWPQVSLENSVS